MKRFKITNPFISAVSLCKEARKVEVVERAGRKATSRKRMKRAEILLNCGWWTGKALRVEFGPCGGVEAATQFIVPPLLLHGLNHVTNRGGAKNKLTPPLISYSWVRKWRSVSLIVSLLLLFERDFRLALCYMLL